MPSLQYILQALLLAVTDFKTLNLRRWKLKQNKLCMFVLPFLVVIISTHTEFILFPSFYVYNFEESNSKNHGTYKKQKKSILLLSFSSQHTMLITRLNTLGGKPVEPGHPFFFKVGV